MATPFRSRGESNFAVMEYWSAGVMEPGKSNVLIIAQYSNPPTLHYSNDCELPPAMDKEPKHRKRFEGEY
jgi:hypothetical protein